MWIAAALLAAAAPVGDACAREAERPAAGDPRGELLFLAVRVNGLPCPGTFLVGRDGEGYYLQRADFAALQLVPPDGPVTRIHGRDFVPLAQLPGARVSLDAGQQQLRIDVPDAAMDAAAITLAQVPVDLTPQGRIAFLNYDVAITQDSDTGVTAYLDGGYSTRLGLFSASGLVEAYPGAKQVTRLETAFLRDDPRNLRRLVIGDTFTALSQIASPVRFGGFRFGSEFALQPGLIFYPAPSLRGRSSVPTTVDVIVNNVLRQREDVSAGPFVLQDLPVLTGAGQVTLAVPDALGVDQRVSSSYYVSPRLLRPGLADWSLEGGAVRRRFGIGSFDYGPAFLAAAYRRGLSDSVTAGGRVEIGKDRQALGAEANVVLASLVELGGGVMLSHGARGTGLRYSLFARRDTPAGSIGMRFEKADDRADRLEDLGGAIPVRWQLQASAGRTLGRFGTLAGTATEVRYRDGSHVRLLTATYSTGLLRLGQLSGFATHSRVRGRGGRLQVGVSFAVAIGPRLSGYVQADNRGAYVEARRTPPYDGGLGYRVGVGGGKDARQQADVEWLTDSGQFMGQFARHNGRSAGRVIARGAALFGGGAVRMTRQVQDGMGIVEVPGHAGVGVYYDNRLVTHTDREGRAVVTGLRPYERNRISIDTTHMPIGTGVSASDVIAVPRYRGVARILFDARVGRSATIRLVTPGGDPVPVGAGVRVDGRPRGFVGYGGETYLVDIAAGMALDVALDGGGCRAELPALGDDPLARIGPVPCLPVAGPAS